MVRTSFWQIEVAVVVGAAAQTACAASIAPSHSGVAAVMQVTDVVGRPVDAAVMIVSAVILAILAATLVRQEWPSVAWRQAADGNLATDRQADSHNRIGHFSTVKEEIRP